MKRPAGVIFSAVLLGLNSALTLFGVLGLGIAAFAMGGMPVSPVDAQAPVPPPPALFHAIFLIMAVLLILVAAWQIATLVGLLRLRNWARYSVLILAGLITLFGLFSTATSIFIAAFLPRLAAQANGQSPASPVPPHLMQAVFLAQGLFYLAVTAVGIWWLVYFNRSKVKQYFLPARYALPTALPPVDRFDYVPAAPPQPGRFTHVPWPILIIAGFFAMTSVSCLALCWIPFPALFMGMLLYSPWNHLTILALSVACGLLAWGLVRLDYRARWGLYGFTLYALLNFVLMLTPHGRASYQAYQQSLLSWMHLPVSPYANPIDVTSTPFVLMMIVFSLVFYGVQLWCVEHYRSLFTATPPPV